MGVGAGVGVGVVAEDVEVVVDLVRTLPCDKWYVFVCKWSTVQEGTVTCNSALSHIRSAREVGAGDCFCETNISITWCI